MRVCAECEEGCEASDCGCMGGACATRDFTDDVYFGIGPLVAEGVGERGVFNATELRGVRQVVVCVVLPFYLSLFYRGVATSGV
jgi:hypothetical protein